MATKEHDLVRAILQAAPILLPGWKLWRQNTGAIKIPESNRFIRFGIPGQADITGITSGGRRVEIEVKSKTGRQSESQKAFQKMIEGSGGIYMLVRSIEEVKSWS